MKRGAIVAAGFVAFYLAAAPGARSQPFVIDSFSIAGGGGTSTGGLFVLSGTLGQPDTGSMSGGNYSLVGGFWGASPAPTPTVIEVRVVNSRLQLRFNGIPGRTYDIERAQDVTGPWRANDQPFATLTMPIGGVVDFVDATNPDAFSRQFFYRTRLR